MANNRDISWTRIFAEGGAILVSILLAFWIDAWWEDRSDAIQERSLLNALMQDFQAAQNEFQRISAAHQKVFGSMETILYWAEAGSVPAEDIASVDAFLGSVFNRSTFDPPMGAVDTILSSGRLELLGNPKLVTELTRWRSLVEDLKERENVAADHFLQAVYPYLSSNLNIQDLDKGIPYPGGVPWPQQPANAYLLVPNREFHNIIYVHWVLYWNVTIKLPKIEDTLDRISELTASELAD
jgi:hypothetical protein